MKRIKIKGDDLLNRDEKVILDKLTDEYLNKIQRKFQNSLLEVHIKVYDKDGQRKKFSLNVHLISTKGNIDASDADWDFSRVLHKVFNKILNEIEHRFHISDQHKR